MKTHVNLWPHICTFENLYLAWLDTRRGKSSKRQAVHFENQLEENLCALLDELQSAAYQPGQYTSFYIYEKKRRKISAAPFRDRVVHHALCREIEPIFERRFITDSYACRRGKGTHRALDRCTHFARRYAYVLKCDVAKFFPSIDHEILRGILGHVIRDRAVMDLIDKILASGADVLRDEGLRVWFPGDDLFAVLRPRGLPIGNLTSQLWANVYLNELDQFIKRELRVKGYLRYADDFLLFADSKAQLWDWRERTIEKLAELRLKPNSRSFYVIPVAQGIEFLGFRVYPDHRRLLAENVLRARRRFRSLSWQFSRRLIGADRVTASVQAWIAHAAHGDTWGLRRAVLREFTGKRCRDARVTDLRQDRSNDPMAAGLYGQVSQVAAIPAGQTDRGCSLPLPGEHSNGGDGVETSESDRRRCAVDVVETPAADGDGDALDDHGTV
jgi:RNA-directed DNA polymerase